MPMTMISSSAAPEITTGEAMEHQTALFQNFHVKEKLHIKTVILSQSKELTAPTATPDATETINSKKNKITISNLNTKNVYYIKTCIYKKHGCQTKLGSRVLFNHTNSL